MFRKATLGKVYQKGETIIRQGEKGSCMYVIQKGSVEVFLERPQGNISLETLKSGGMFGEMSLFTKAPRSATVVAKDEVRILTIDKKTFLKRLYQEDPSLAFRILQNLCTRISTLNNELSVLKNSLNEKEGNAASSY